MAQVPKSNESKNLNSISDYLRETSEITKKVNVHDINAFIYVLEFTKQRGGRVFVLGLGGSAATASHLVNDLRKLCGIEAYCPTDNVSQFSAIANDAGFDKVFVDWFKESNLSGFDTIIILSVGGGLLKYSKAIRQAINLANKHRVAVLSIIGKTTGYAYEHSDVSILVPEVNKDRITPHTEGFTSVLLHLIVSDPRLQQNKTTW